MLSMCCLYTKTVLVEVEVDIREREREFTRVGPCRPTTHSWLLTRTNAVGECAWDLSYKH